ncbi:[Fe-Fe] hydrogenase large subunit C-terminal domain-containing protein [Paludicola sp. MB14-C6]|uniref:[Fe-Fe] hydrogenase large subunit C-terminal domain-containing protein n=1 Tax=Paludihabitans sp. MB14-C6 TaxID=3070656 RepID=UPI0027DBF9C3|nr:[Fe-Fe] hydrogenase large subunit C-terminal domain-containing protein [Paludicola sp. MB14-C6]WMJ22089.1 [Fe-Fe] hydrogenase large subunit C-terminal domain-containing protein [Paludicola sp. MB14-C6]
MSIIRLNASNCQNCYKCIRECPLKAIEFKDSKTKIIDTECVLCGNCMETCPKGAKYFRRNTDKVKELLASEKPVYVSLAPSYVGWYQQSFSQISQSLKQLGFAGVEETAIGAACVSKEYAKLMQNGQMKNIIATACSSIVMLIERHFPSLIKMLAPVSSPMMAHARLMRETYGDIKVVFIGPCLSKMYEAEDPLSGGLVNEVLTFQDIDEWLQEEHIPICKRDEHTVGVLEPISRIYPKQEGIIKTIPPKDFYEYTPISVDGIDRCIEFFTAMQKEEISGLFIEANICAGSCIGGPIMRMHQKSILQSTAKLKADKLPIDDMPAKSAQVEFSHPRVFTNRKAMKDMPTEAQIKEILAKIGKTTVEQELNCGSCGYPTCRQKAIAVFQKKADVTMCLPFLRERAENMSSLVIENSPNGIISFDEMMLVTDLNPKAEELFGVTRAEIIGEIIPALYGLAAFEEAKIKQVPIVCISNGYTEEIKVEITVIYVQKNNMFIAFAKDISEQEKNKEELAKLRFSTVDVAQNVIEKQMRVAQEIASLLGETTAETKVALTNLKRSIKDISEA